MGALKWTVTSGPPVSVFVEVSLELAEDANVFLHWGSAPAAGCEWEPISALPANATAFDEIASRTPVQSQARATLIFPSKAPRWVSFVLYVQTGPGEMWLKREGGDNFWIPVLASPDEAPAEVSAAPRGVGDRFCQAEIRSQHYTQKDRICLASDVLSGSVGIEEAAWLATCLCLADAKALEWYRKSGYQPKDMASAQERIGGVLATAIGSATDPRVRTLLRLCVKAVPRGSGSGGDAIRHGILNIMRTHGIKEGHRPGIECKFLEQWHQKLHTNSAPDDIAIGEGYLAFLASGNADEMWRVMWEVGKVSREDLGKMCQMGFKDHTKSGGRGLNFVPVHLPHMYNDVKNFLGLLRHVHGGSDLFSLCEACKGQYPDHDSECLAFGIFHSRDDPFSMGKILDLRRRLESVRWKRDILMLDVAMEDQLRSLAERTDPSNLGRDELLNLICMILEDLMVSRHDLSLQQGYELLDRLSRGDAGGLQKWSPDWCKMLHAACDRLALSCTDTADGVMRVLQECADRLLEEGQKPGSAFCPDPKHLETFGEEKARCLSERVLAQILKVLMPQLRRWAGLGPWQLVASFPALGTLQPLQALPAELTPGQEPMVALVETMTGWEDIPAGITAILLPAGQAVDTLSHVAIRARNQQVLLASCDEEATLAELRRLAGTPLRLQVSASGDVTWEKAELPTKASATATSAPTRLADTMQKPPKPPGIVLPSADFTKNSRSIGGKSLHLAELAAASGGFAVPNSATVPYGVFEQVLSESANHGLLEELEEILGEGALEEARQFLVDELAVPDEIGTALCKALGRSDLGDWKSALCRVWASKWTDRAVASRKQMKVPDSALYLAVLVQPLVFAQYAFVIHTQSPLPGAAKGEQLVELCVGLGESLVSNSPGRALSASVGDGGASITIHVFPSKPEGVFAPEGGTIIFRSDSNGEDLEGFAGAGLYDSVTVQSCEHRTINYAAEPLFFDAGFRSKLLKSLFELGRKIEANFAGQPQDIEGAVTAEGKVVVTQSRPQV